MFNLFRCHDDFGLLIKKQKQTNKQIYIYIYKLHLFYFIYFSKALTKLTKNYRHS